MAIVRWDPFREFATLQNQMNRLFQDLTPTRTGTGEEFMTAGTFVPPVDIYEDEHSITLKLEVPGIEEKDLDIKVENQTLTVHGERKLEKELKQENFHRIERTYGAFSRSFTLPNTVDTENIGADYQAGVLTVKLAKRAEARPKQIKVNIGPKTIEGKKTAA